MSRPGVGGAGPADAGAVHACRLREHMCSTRTVAGNWFLLDTEGGTDTVRATPLHARAAGTHHRTGSGGRHSGEGVCSCDSDGVSARSRDQAPTALFSVSHRDRQRGGSGAAYFPHGRRWGGSPPSIPSVIATGGIRAAFLGGATPTSMAGLGVLPQKLTKCIVAKEFIDMRELLPESWRLRLPAVRVNLGKVCPARSSKMISSCTQS